MAKKTASPHESSSEGNQIAITVTEKGPYLVTGNPPLAMQFIMPDSEGESWYFQEGRHFSTEKEPTALCPLRFIPQQTLLRRLAPQWGRDSAITSGEDRITDEVEITEGQRVTLNDNEKYCVFARFCHPYGGVWDLTAASGDSQSRKLAVREASMCPSARLTAWDNRTGKPYEFIFEPSLGLIEDPAIGASGGLWVRGGIHIQREDGRTFEVRNRVVLCRCGHSRQQALLRRCACRRQMARRAGGNPRRRNAPPKRCQCKNRNPLTGLPFHSNKIESTGTLYGLARHTSAPKRDAPFYNTLR